MMNSGPGFLYLPDEALEALGILPSDLADAIETALVDKAEGRLHVTPKSAILPGEGRYMMSTLAVGAAGLTVLKTATVSPGNPARGLPAVNAAIVVTDSETGLLKAVLGGNWITAHRTAALSAVAARRLAPSDAETALFVGTGVQARSHLLAFREIFPLKRIAAIGRGRANLVAFLEFARGLGLEAREAADPEAGLREADLVISSVSLDYATRPFLDARLLKPGAFAAISDLCIPWLPEGMPAFGTIVVDDIEQERSAPRPMLAPDLVAGDLTGLALGRVGARIPGRPAAFAFRGIALGDYAAATLALARAEAIGAGLRVSPSAIDTGR